MAASYRKAHLLEQKNIQVLFLIANRENEDDFPNSQTIGRGINVRKEEDIIVLHWIIGQGVGGGEVDFI